MKVSRILYASLWLCAISMAMTFVGCHRTSEAKKVSRDEAAMWARATRTVVPRYPESSLRRRSQGVAVALLLVGTEGRVRDVDVLEAPDGEVGTAVQAALRQWTFAPTTLLASGEAAEVTGKVTFYFEVSHGKGEVLSAAEKVERRASRAPEKR